LTPKVDVVVLMWATQLGKSELLLNLILYFCVVEPCTILMVRDTLEEAESFSKTRLAPMFKDTPILRPLLNEVSGNKKDNNTIRQKQLNNGAAVFFATATSESALSSKPARIVLIDEADRYTVSKSNKGGSPIDLAIQRAENFWNKKIIIVSSPSIKGHSPIQQWFDRSNKQRFYIPCSKCGFEQTLVWKNVFWPKERPEEAYYECESCNAKLNDGDLQGMVGRGHWVADNPEVEKIQGFHLNGIYSPWVSLARLAEKKVATKGDKEKLKTFVNTSLAECWEENRLGELVDFEGLYAERLNYTKVPKDVCILVASVDLHKDFQEVLISGFGRDEVWYTIRHHVIHLPLGDRLWKELDSVLMAEYESEHGVPMRISRALVDSGKWANDVYDYCRNRWQNGVYPIKGDAGYGAQTVVGRSKRHKGVPFFHINTFVGKQVLFSRLGEKEVKGRIFFHSGLDIDFFQQFNAEVLRERRNKGQLSLIYEQIKKRNEAIDLMVYCYAAFKIANPNIDHWFKKINEAKNSHEQILERPRTASTKIKGIRPISWGPN
jgi:phage terminase large subunit GpA-like protein